MDRKVILLCALLVMAVAIVPFLNTLQNTFTFDDRHIIVENDVVKRFSIAEIFSTPYWGAQKGKLEYRPVSTISHAIDYAFFHLNPLPQHLFNILLHSVNSMLAFYLLFLLSRRIGFSLAAGFLFAVHPIHTEAVANLVGRSELLTFFFTVLSLFAFLHAARFTGLRKRTLHSLCILFFLVGLLCKENGIAIFPVAILAAITIQKSSSDSLLSRLRSCSLFLVPLLFFLSFRYFVLGTLIRPEDYGISILDNPIAGAPGAMIKVFTALSVMGKYILLLFFPIRLSADYSFHQIPLATSAFSIDVALPILFSLALFFALLVWRKKALLFLFFVGFSFIAFLPVSNLFFTIGTIMGERLLYLPSFGFLAAFTWVLTARPLWKGKKTLLVFALLILMILLFAVRSYERNRDWRDDRTLFERTLQTSPASCKIHYNLGVLYTSDKQVPRARDMFIKTLDIYGQHAAAWNALGLLYMKEYGREKRLGLGGGAIGKPLSEAFYAFERAVKSNPGYKDGWLNLGTVYFERKEFETALEAFRTSHSLYPSGFSIHYNLGTTHHALARRKLEKNLLQEATEHLQKAIRHLETATGIDPSRQTAKKRLERCIKRLSEVTNEANKKRDTPGSERPR